MALSNEDYISADDPKSASVGEKKRIMHEVEQQKVQEEISRLLLKQKSEIQYKLKKEINPLKLKNDKKKEKEKIKDELEDQLTKQIESLNKDVFKKPKISKRSSSDYRKRASVRI